MISSKAGTRGKIATRTGAVDLICPGTAARHAEPALLRTDLLDNPDTVLVQSHPAEVVRALG
ncbi:hypothetical protein ACQPZF_16345 [Actinosynnema sp. CS-041913]|uniref:hypothetical protein n=1 Tax=Actinosynnema sp. CS-041913 TaxID=3239917 RepID=UPI003D90AB1F